MEFLAAFTGSLYLWRNKFSSRKEKLFVIFLWSVLFIDVFGSYSLWAFFDNYETLPFLKNSIFVRNIWYYNLAQVYFTVCYAGFMQSEIENSKIAATLRLAIHFFIIYSLMVIAWSEDLFLVYITPIFLVGTLLILLSVFLYFIDLLRSEKILVFYKNLFFYVFIGVLIHYLVVQPVTIYSVYFNEDNPEYVNLFAAILRLANIFMYGMFILGFAVNYVYKADPVALKTTKKNAF